MCCRCRTVSLFNANLLDTVFFQACATSVNLCAGYHAWQQAVPAWGRCSPQACS